MRKLLFSNKRIILKKNDLLLRNNHHVRIHHTTAPKEGGSIIGQNKPYRLIGTVQSPSMGYNGSAIMPSSLSSDLSRLNFSNKKNKNVRLRQ
jgi:hypothetical protein